MGKQCFTRRKVRLDTNAMWESGPALKLGQIVLTLKLVPSDVGEAVFHALLQSWQRRVSIKYKCSSIRILSHCM